MSKAAERLRSIGIYNPHDAVSKVMGVGEISTHPIYIDYRPAVMRMDVPGAQVVGVGFKTDPGGHWKENGCKTFRPYEYGGRKGAMDAAQEWASSEYGVDEWGKIPGLPDALFPADVVAAVKALLKEACE